MKPPKSRWNYFPHGIQISAEMRHILCLNAGSAEPALRPDAPSIIFYRLAAARINRIRGGGAPSVSAGSLAMFALLNRIFSHILDTYLDRQYPAVEDGILVRKGLSFTDGPLSSLITDFARFYPSAEVVFGSAATAEEYLSRDDRRKRKRRRITREMLLLRLSMENRALAPLRDLFDDQNLAAATPYLKITSDLEDELKKAPPFEPLGLPVLELLRTPMRSCPDYLGGQLQFIKDNWAAIIPDDMVSEILSTFDMVREEETKRQGAPGPPVVLEFGPGAYRREADEAAEYPDFERFSPDTEWMPNVVLMAKMVYVWLDQLSKKYGRPINRLDEIPDEELDTLAEWGFTGLWLIGLWERSPASAAIKRLCGNPDAISSAYSLYDYVIAADLGGEEAVQNLKHRASLRGIRLASDMVPNHTGIDSRWIREHPDWFIQLDYPPYPTYRFEGPDLSSSPDISIRIEDGYWSRTDAAVVFQHIDNRTGRIRYIYHGNDGTSTPWNDTAQLNYLLPEVREAVIRTIIQVARCFPIIRFDAAMTLAKKHYQRLWFPQVGLGGGIPSRAEHALTRQQFDELFPEEFWRQVVDRVAEEAPDTLLLAEAFWLMEGYFVRTLGMHRVYNSAFMNMIKMEENAKYRQTIKNVLEFNPEILQRFVNFMNNPDESTAIEQFGREAKYFGAAVLLTTMPGLPMFGHGQVEGFTEKYGMEYRRAYWDEEPDRHLVEMHVRKIFPLMKKRRLFSGAENFVLYDFLSGDGVDENVFAYSNSRGEEKALIVYHNRFASTSGRIITSSLRTVKDSSGGTRQVRTTLAEALGVKAEGRHFYRFRDYASGLEYLRQGRDLAEQGLMVRLDAYEYHAFLDFREIRDDDYNNWARLCETLEGRGVENLDEEFRQVRHAAVIAAFASLVLSLRETLPLLFDGKGETRESAMTMVRERLLHFFTCAKEEASLQGDPHRAAEQALADMDFTAGLTSVKSRSRKVRAALDTAASVIGKGKEFDRFFLATFLALRRAGGMAGKEAAPSETVRLLSELGLDRAINSAFVDAAAFSAGLSEPETPAALSLMKALLVHHLPFQRWPDTTVRTGWVKRIFHDDMAREYLQVHLSGGIEWFSKERFEKLMRWLFLAALMEPPAVPADRKLTDASLARMHNLASNLIADAEKSGYRAGAMMEV